MRRFRNKIRAMGKVRDSERTRKRITDAAAREFAAKGFDGATLSEIARRARVSKQLIHHHFHSKEGLFQEVHDLKFRPADELHEELPGAAADLLSERFRMRAGDADYIRFLTWEAASGRGQTVPGHDARQRRIADFGRALRLMQAAGELPKDLDYRLIHLAMLALATYPMAFGQITRLVTGRDATDPRFQQEWNAFLQRIGQTLFGKADIPQRKRTRTARKPKKR
jgi:TetR/AcrR family transcriptional regulator